MYRQTTRFAAHAVDGQQLMRTPQLCHPPTYRGNKAPPHSHGNSTDYIQPDIMAPMAVSRTSGFLARKKKARQVPTYGILQKE